MLDFGGVGRARARCKGVRKVSSSSDTGAPFSRRKVMVENEVVGERTVVCRGVRPRESRSSISGISGVMKILVSRLCLIARCRAVW